MPPEILRQGADVADARADVYSLGVTLYEMLTLRCPYIGEDSEITRQQILAGRAPLPSRIASSVSWDLETVCLVAMNPEPASRYATAAELEQDLARALQHQPILARRASLWTRTRRFVVRNPGWSAAIAIAVLSLFVLSIGSAWFAIRQSQFLKTERNLNSSLTSALNREQKANRHIDEQRQAIAKEKQKVEAALAQSNRNLDAAREAVFRFFTIIGDTTLENYPQSEALRKKLLAQAAEFFRQCQDLGGNDPQDRHLLAYNLGLLGVRLENLGEFEQAQEAYEDSLRIRKELLQEQPDVIRWKEDYAETANSLAILCLMRKQIVRGVEVAEEAVARFEELIELAPDNIEYKTSLAVATADIAEPYLQLGQPERALDYLDRRRGHASRSGWTAAIQPPHGPAPRDHSTQPHQLSVATRGI